MTAQRAAQCMVHSLAKIAARLCPRVRKQGVALREVQLDRSTARLARRAQRAGNEPRVQTRRASRAEKQGEAGLHASGERRAREHDD